jgi:hypothetical protein
MKLLKTILLTGLMGIVSLQPSFIAAENGIIGTFFKRYSPEYLKNIVAQGASFIQAHKKETAISAAIIGLGLAYLVYKKYSHAKSQINTNPNSHSQEELIGRTEKMIIESYLKAFIDDETKGQGLINFIHSNLNTWIKNPEKAELVKKQIYVAWYAYNRLDILDTTNERRQDCASKIAAILGINLEIK